MKDAETVAKELLGKLLCRKMPNGEIVKLVIMETEAYPADDTACYGYGYEGNHGNKKKTAANAPLFEIGGSCCIYGGMLLIVCGAKEKPDNVLICAGICNDDYYDGPCNVANALSVDKTLHGISIAESRSKLWIEEKTANTYISVVRKGLGNSVTAEDQKRKLRFFAL